MPTHHLLIKMSFRFSAYFVKGTNKSARIVFFKQYILLETIFSILTMYCVLLCIINCRLHSWLQSDPVGRQFRTSFLWEKQGAGNPINDSSGGLRLAAWKFTFWLPHSLDADALLNWFKHTQKLLKDSKDLFESHAFTPLALLWESDPFTVKSTVNSLLSALLAIICVSKGNICI